MTIVMVTRWKVFVGARAQTRGGMTWTGSRIPRVTKILFFECLLFTNVYLHRESAPISGGLIATAWIVHDGWQSLLTIPWR